MKGSQGVLYCIIPPIGRATLQILGGSAREHRVRPFDCCLALCRGRCDTDIPGNMGKLMRSVVVRKLREGLPPGEEGTPREKIAPEINVCCHGQDAGTEVRRSHLRHLILRLQCFASCFPEQRPSLRVRSGEGVPFLSKISVARLQCELTT